MALVEKELASWGDPAITLSFNMHHVMVGIFRDLLQEEARTRLFRQVVEDNALISGPFSEERAGFSTIADTVASTAMVDGMFRARRTGQPSSRGRTSSPSTPPLPTPMERFRRTMKSTRHASSSSLFR